MNRVDLPIARGQLRGRASVGRPRVKVGVTVSLALIVDSVVICQPSQSKRSRSIDPRIIMKSRGYFRPAGRRVKRKNPAIFIVTRARKHNGFRPVVGPERLKHLNIALAGLISSPRTGVNISALSLL